MDSTPRHLSDAAIVVTGGASGIGRAIALRFAESGAKFLASDLLSYVNGESLVVDGGVHSTS